MTKKLEDFDFEATCRALEGVAAGAASEEASDAVELAAYALHFLYVKGQLPEFREYLRDIKEPAEPESAVEREFAEMEQARGWLLTEPPPAPQTRIRVAGKMYITWRDAGGTLRLVPTPSASELEE